MEVTNGDNNSVSGTPVPDLPKEIWNLILRKRVLSWDLRSLTNAGKVSRSFRKIVDNVWGSIKFVRLSCMIKGRDGRRVVLFSLNETLFSTYQFEREHFWRIQQVCLRFTGLTHLQLDTDLEPEDAEDYDHKLKILWKCVGKGLFHCFPPGIELRRLDVWNEFLGMNLVSFLVAKFSDSLQEVDLSIETPEEVSIDLLWSSLELCVNLRSLAYENGTEDCLNDDMLCDALEGKKQLEELTLWGLNEVSHQGIYHALKAAGCKEQLKTFRLLMLGGVSAFFRHYLEVMEATRACHYSYPLSNVRCFVYRSSGGLECVDYVALFQVFPVLEELRIVGPDTYREPATIAHHFLSSHHSLPHKRNLRLCCHPRFPGQPSNDDNTYPNAKWDFRLCINQIVEFEDVNYPTSTNNLQDNKDPWSLNTRIVLRRGTASVTFDTRFPSEDNLWPCGLRFR